MSDTLILCEKPKQARDLADALGGKTGSGAGYIDCPAGRLTWAIGHLVGPCHPEDYDERYKKWDLSHLPIIPEVWRRKVNDGVRQQYNAVIKCLKSAKTVFIATDAGREGELIAYELIQSASYKGAIKRLWFSAQNAAALQKAWAAPRDASETVGLFYAAELRQRADWLYGMNFSRALTILRAPAKSVFSYGRVQTPTLNMIVMRDRAIDAFKPVNYFDLTASVTSGQHSLKMHYRPNEERRILNRADAESIRARIMSAQKSAITVTAELKKEAPQKLFALSDLQGAANSAYSLSAKDTLDIAQSLYENHKLISYPRSDCNYLPSDMAADAPKIISNLVAGGVIAAKPAKLQARKSVFDDKKLSDHHAIIPTAELPDLNKLNDLERKIYRLIAVRYVQSFMPDYEYDSVKMQMSANGVPLVASGTTPVILGWRELEDKKASAVDDDDENEVVDNQILPPIRSGDPGQVVSAEVNEKTTKPPSRYTEKTLLADMKSVQKFVSDERYKAILKETHGIGTEATRASIIETLKKRGFIEVKGRKIFSTSIGRQLIDVVPEVLRDPVMTALWEDHLERVANREDSPGVVMKSFVAQMQQQLDVVLALPKVDKGQAAPAEDKQTRSRSSSTKKSGYKRTAAAKSAISNPTPVDEGSSLACPKCQAPMILRTSSRGKFYGCSKFPKCKSTVNV